MRGMSVYMREAFEIARPSLQHLASLGMVADPPSPSLQVGFITSLKKARNHDILSKVRCNFP